MGQDCLDIKYARHSVPNFALLAVDSLTLLSIFCAALILHLSAALGLHHLLALHLGHHGRPWHLDHVAVPVLRLVALFLLDSVALFPWNMFNLNKFF